MIDQAPAYRYFIKAYQQPGAVTDRLWRSLEAPEAAAYTGNAKPGWLSKGDMRQGCRISTGFGRPSNTWAGSWSLLATESAPIPAMPIIGSRQGADESAIGSRQGMEVPAAGKRCRFCE